ncbi:tRNA pseudouridine(38-40) synthase TruA [Thioalkalivibrio sp. ALJ16]|uniref:tRNA pseudouridine(38-40) synthase TruA n=1 Tax=Thioalkalivibrio sp. ALJ16 TaxID=1158762 RepID=UPI0003809678|nr:tRNA pseudouridine(38-40) synthase TruA [Thioalkalivibrio sp. ALJ16]
MGGETEQQDAALRRVPGGGLQRWALGVEYDGRGLLGWQRQKDGPSVQEHLEAALGYVANHPVELGCAGRTDAGVHATAQVVHFDSPSRREAGAWVLGSNSRLPDGIAVTWARAVPTRFHARFGAFGRRYRYVILNRAVRPALDAGRVSWWRRPLDAERMHYAGQAFVGEHDFTSLRAAACQAKSPMRRVHSLSVRRHGSLVVLDIHANAFLHHMVRNIAGVLLAVGDGRMDTDWPQQVLAARDRRASGITAPAGGLYFVHVDYPAEFELPVTAGPVYDGVPGNGAG